MSSLQPLVVVFCAPLAGLVLDHWGGQIFVLLVANLVTIVAYFLLWQVNPMNNKLSLSLAPTMKFVKVTRLLIICVTY